jgi:hypothetical protein
MASPTLPVEGRRPVSDLIYFWETRPRRAARGDPRSAQGNSCISWGPESERFGEVVSPELPEGVVDVARGSFSKPEQPRASPLDVSVTRRSHPCPLRYAFGLPLREFERWVESKWRNDECVRLIALQACERLPLTERREPPVGLGRRWRATCYGLCQLLGGGPPSHGRMLHTHRKSF